jgi:hypothetical protein
MKQAKSKAPTTRSVAPTVPPGAGINRSKNQLPGQGRSKNQRTILYGKNTRVKDDPTRPYARPVHSRNTETGWAPLDRMAPIIMPDEVYTAQPGARLYFECFGAWYVREAIAWVRERVGEGVAVA